MKKLPVILAFSVFMPFINHAQVTLTRFNVLPAFTATAQYDLAMTQQFGVIGNNFISDIEIGKTPAETVSSFNSLYPIDGFKRTICGTFHQYFIKTKDNVDDDDVHFNIRPELASRELLNDINRQIKDVNIAKLKGFNFKQNVIEAVSNPDINTVAGIEAYNAIIGPLNKSISAINSSFGTRQLREMKAVVFGEIDLPFHQFLTKFGDNVPKEELDCGCIFGPWVNDRLSVPFGSFHDNIEIHPAEQVWWTYKKNSNETVYFLGAFGENSGIFHNREHYDTDGGKLSFFGPWHPCPQRETYAIPFEIKNKMPTLTFTLEKNVSNGGAVRTPNEPPTRVLMFKNDTLLRVHNATLMDVSFDKIGISKIVNQDTFIKGFLVLQTNISGNSDCNGTVITKVTANKNKVRILPPFAVQVPTLKVTLKNIQCLAIDDGNGNTEEEILGYAGVVAFSAKTGISKIPIMPKNKESFLLFNRLDKASLNLKKNQIVDINESRIFEMDNEDYIVIKSNLDEDDNNDDNNINDLDEDDDRLADANTKGKAVKSDIFFVKKMTAGSKIETKHTFSSGGTKVVLTFLVERVDSGSILTKGN